MFGHCVEETGSSVGHGDGDWGPDLPTPKIAWWLVRRCRAHLALNLSPTDTVCLAFYHRLCWITKARKNKGWVLASIFRLLNALPAP